MKNCYKCGSPTYYESIEQWSPYGLHKLGLYKPETKTLLRCQKCNAIYYDREESRKKAKTHEISWEEFRKRFPEIPIHGT